MNTKKLKSLASALFNSKIKDESGIALITALLIMVLITILGTAAIMTSTTDVKISSNFKKSLEAFYVAEAGIETGLDFLDSNVNADTGWTNFINDGTNDIIYPNFNDITATVTADAAVGSGNFTLSVGDDTDLSTTEDTNLRIHLKSVGTITLDGSTVATTTLEVFVEYDQPYESYGGKDLTSGNTNVASGEATWSIN